jgi:L-threonylcarbamoyladenylate synthase
LLAEAVIGQDLDLATELLKKGEIVGIPTETVYGLAGNALNEEAVLKIFKAKNRPFFDPLIIHTFSIPEARKYVLDFPEEAEKLGEKFWPGPLTILLPKKTSIPDLVTSGSDKVAIRIPKHPLTLSLLKKLEFPLAAPSANPFGYVSPTNPQHVKDQLGEVVPYILDGGECHVGVESTIIGFEDGKPVMYRPGGIPAEEIEKLIGKVEIRMKSVLHPLTPGMLDSHYSPGKQVIIINEAVGVIEHIDEAGYLGFHEKHPIIPKEHQMVLSPSGSLEEAARNLFSYLREMDKMPIRFIYTKLLPDQGLGRAINDRLRRASVKKTNL